MKKYQKTVEILANFSMKNISKKIMKFLTDFLTIKIVKILTFFSSQNKSEEKKFMTIFLLQFFLMNFKQCALKPHLEKSLGYRVTYETSFLSVADANEIKNA